MFETFVVGKMITQAWLEAHFINASQFSVDTAEEHVLKREVVVRGFAGFLGLPQFSK